MVQRQRRHDGIAGRNRNAEKAAGDKCRSTRVQPRGGNGQDALILVDADSVIYMKREKSKPLVLFEVAKGMVTGSKPDVGDVRKDPHDHNM